MNDVASDYRIKLIDLFFAIVITIGLSRFFSEVILKGAFKLYYSFYVPALLDILFFIITFFWVVSYWVIYHVAIKDHPYILWRKFYVDVIGFSCMFIILNTSFLASSGTYFPSFISLVCLWHISDFGTKRSRDSIYDDLHSHIFRIGVYVSILLSFLIIPSLLDHISAEIVRYIIMIISFSSMFILSFIKLKAYIRRDEQDREEKV
jgi:hypothetical protein